MAKIVEKQEALWHMILSLKATEGEDNADEKEVDNEANEGRNS